jgi:bacteriorhodopsin
MFGMAVIPLIVAMVVGVLLAPLLRTRSGDPTILWVAVVVAFLGVVLLFIARLPLYGQRRFFTLGAGLLDERHRRIYRWAYRFIGTGALVLVLLHLTLR